MSDRSRDTPQYTRRRPRRWTGPLVLLTLLLLVPVVEIVVVVVLVRQLGALPTLGLVVGTTALGSLVVGRQAPRTWRTLRESLSAERLREGRLPGRELLDGALVLLGGVLLLVPGVVSDVLGLLCLLPFTRPLMRLLLLVWVRRRAAAAALRVRRVGPTRGAVVGGEVVDGPGPSKVPGAAGTPTTPGPGGPRVVEGTVLPPD